MVDRVDRRAWPLVECRRPFAFSRVHIGVGFHGRIFSVSHFTQRWIHLKGWLPLGAGPNTDGLQLLGFCSSTRPEAYMLMTYGTFMISHMLLGAGIESGGGELVSRLACFWRGKQILGAGAASVSRPIRPSFGLVSNTVDRPSWGWRCCFFRGCRP